MLRHLILVSMCATTIACAQTPSKPAPTAADARAFLATANATTLKLGTEQGQAGWVQQTFITDDSDRGTRQPGVQRGRREVRQGGGAVRRGDGLGR
jgi:hypothetical protein